MNVAVHCEAVWRAHSDRASQFVTRSDRADLLLMRANVRDHSHDYRRLSQLTTKLQPVQTNWFMSCDRTLTAILAE